MNAIVEMTSAHSAHERGSASIVVIAAGALVLTVGVFGAVRADAVLARHRIERAADLVALAGAEQIGRSNDPCSAAARLAAVNHVRLSRCQVSLDATGRSGRVTVGVSTDVRLPVVGTRPVSATARAARLSPTDHL